MEKIKVRHEKLSFENEKGVYKLSWRYAPKDEDDASMQIIVNKIYNGEFWCVDCVESSYIIPREVFAKIEAILRGLNSGRS